MYHNTSTCLHIFVAAMTDLEPFDCFCNPINPSYFNGPLRAKSMELPELVWLPDLHVYVNFLRVKLRLS